MAAKHGLDGQTHRLGDFLPWEEQVFEVLDFLRLGRVGHALDVLAQTDERGDVQHPGVMEALDDETGLAPLEVYEALAAELEAEGL